MTTAELAQGLCTVPEAMVFLKLSRATVYTLMGQGRLPWVRGLGRARRIPRAALVALVQKNLTPVKRVW